jgi:hypothetical protein
MCKSAADDGSYVSSFTIVKSSISYYVLCAINNMHLSGIQSNQTSDIQLALDLESKCTKG